MMPRGRSSSVCSRGKEAAVSCRARVWSIIICCILCDRVFVYIAMYQIYRKRTEMAKKMYLKQLATYRANQLTKVMQKEQF